VAWADFGRSDELFGLAQPSCCGIPAQVAYQLIEEAGAEHSRGACQKRASGQGDGTADVAVVRPFDGGPRPRLGKQANLARSAPIAQASRRVSRNRELEWMIRRGDDELHGIDAPEWSHAKVQLRPETPGVKLVDRLRTWNRPSEPSRIEQGIADQLAWHGSHSGPAAGQDAAHKAYPAPSHNGLTRLAKTARLSGRAAGHASCMNPCKVLVRLS